MQDVGQGGWVVREIQLLWRSGRERDERVVGGRIL